ncbi:hypothetical protein OUZ56_011172 [Daphnia magna]|uniref:Uncharacterized protein n=1 Tax=Daphnia magna TaxID=35525 RepID=A0ABQ9Z0Q7_9CRUS|nr:hypothetical protein OUZ56_011172 [Daphnia magna]
MKKYCLTPFKSFSQIRERINQVSPLMRDQMDHPLDRAIYWIEYGIRYQGAPHLRTASRKLWLYQRGLLDTAMQ